MKKTMMLLGILIAVLVIIGLVTMVIPRSAVKTSQEVKTSNDGATVQITTLKEGSGAQAVAGDMVTVNYTGKFEDGKVFDTNLDEAFGHVKPLPFTLGAAQVIQGWDQGVLGMKVGEKRHLVIPPSLGYGPKDYGPIPGNSTLIFDVELLTINNK
jgi:FKBP-type peptidyl-prolyl cis-trans isomerase FkpA